MQYLSNRNSNLPEGRAVHAKYLLFITPTPIFLPFFQHSTTFDSTSNTNPTATTKALREWLSISKTWLTTANIALRDIVEEGKTLTTSTTPANGAIRSTGHTTTRSLMKLGKCSCTLWN